MPQEIIIGGNYDRMKENIPFHINFSLIHAFKLAIIVEYFARMPNNGSNSSIKIKMIIYTNVEPKFLIISFVVKPFSSKNGFKDYSSEDC